MAGRWAGSAVLRVVGVVALGAAVTACSSEPQQPPPQATATPVPAAATAPAPAAAPPASPAAEPSPTPAAPTVPTAPSPTAPPAPAPPTVDLHPCDQGIAIPTPDVLPALVADCKILLALKDTLAGTADLNWSGERLMFFWEGVRLGWGRVWQIQLNDRELTGSIPPELSGLTGLTALFLADNELTGSIPPELGALAELWVLDLGGNRLTGRIPAELGGLDKLQYLVLSGNELSGRIPPELGALSALRDLDLEDNRLTGPIPRELGELRELRDLVLAENALSGRIPPELGALSELEDLSLEGNLLVGAIPAGLAALPKIRWVNLERNPLSHCVWPPAVGVDHRPRTLRLPDCPPSSVAGATSGLTPEPEAALSPPPTVRVEVRVWQDVGDELDVRVGARAATGSWRTLGMIPLPLDDGLSRTGQYRYGDTTLAVPVPGRARPVEVDVRVWQHIARSALLYISARPSGGSWSALGTVHLSLDDGHSATGQYRYGDVALDVPLPAVGVATLAGSPGLRGFADGGGGVARFGGRDDHPALGLAVDRSGDVIVADRFNHAVRRVTADGVVTTIAGGPGSGFEDGPAESALFHSPRDVAVTAGGTIYVADYGNHRIRRITPDGMVTTVAGSDRTGAGWREIRDGPAGQALFEGPMALALDDFGDLYIVERYAVRRLSPSGWVTTVAGGTAIGRRDGPVQVAEFTGLYDLDIDDAGNLYLLDDSRGGVGSSGTVAAIRKIDTSGLVTTLHGDESPALGGTLAYASGIAVARDGSIYLANTGRHQLVRLTADGELRAVAGTGESGALDGPRGEATFHLPRRIALAPDGSLLVADQDGSVIRRIVPPAGGFGSAGIPLADFEPLPRVPGVRVSVLAGSGSQGLVDGPGRSARFTLPAGVALDGSGNVIVADRANHAIRAITPDGTVTTIAGDGVEGSRDGPCAEARFAWPRGVAVDANGSIYVADTGGHRIRRIDPGGCSVTTVSGAASSSHGEGSGGVRDGPAAEAEFSDPSGLAFDGEGNFFIADTRNNLIRRLSPDGEVTTVAGPPGRARGSAFNPGSRDGPAEEALFSSPRGIAVDADGNVFFTESNSAIRRLDRSGFVSSSIRTRDHREGGALSPFLSGLAAGAEGELYIVDGGFDRVLMLTRDGVLSIVADRENAAGTGRFDPSGLVVAPDGTLFVSDSTSVVWTITIGDAGE